MPGLTVKSLKSLADATRAAAELGASVAVGGRTINAAGTRMALARGGTAAVAPAPAPTEPDAMDRVTRLMQAQAQLMAAQGQAMSEVLVRMIDHLERAPETRTAAAAPVAAAAPTEQRRPVRFDVVRSGSALSLVPTFGVTAAAVPKTYELQRDAAGRLQSVIPVYH